MRSNFAVLLFSSFLSDAVASVFALYLPLYAYELGADVFEIGLVGGVAYASYSFMPFLIGRYSDKVQRRKDFLVISLAMLAVCSFVYAFISSPVQLIALRILEGVAWATLWPIVDVEVSEDASRESSKALSIYNTVWSAAGAVGPLIGIALIILLTQIRYIFVVTALMMVLATIVNAAFLHDANGKTPAASLAQESDVGTAPARTGPAAVDSIWVFVIALIFQSAIRGVLITFFPPLAESRGASVLIIGVVGFSFYVGRAAIFSFTTRDDFRGFFLKRENLRWILLVSVIVSGAAGALPLLDYNSLVVGLCAFSIVALASSFTMMITQVELITRAETAKKGSGAGVFESTIGIGVALGPMVFGFVSGGSLSVPFLMGPIGLALVLPALLLLFRRRNSMRAVAG